MGTLTGEEEGLFLRVEGRMLRFAWPVVLAVVGMAFLMWLLLEQVPA